MPAIFYKQFEQAPYPCYWLDADGRFWMNRAAESAQPPLGDKEYVHKMLAKMLPELHSGHDPAACSLPLLTDALLTQRLDVLPMKEGLFAAVLQEGSAPSSSFSTQLREPLTNIFAVLPLLAKKLEDSDTRYTDEIQHNSYALLRLASNLENAGRVENKAYNLQVLDLTALVHSLATSADSVCQEQKIPIGWSLPDHPLPVKADTRLLSEAVLNVLRNSLQYTRDGNRITIRLQQTAGQALLTLSDSGLGIKQEHLPLIFNPYFSTDPYGDGSPDPGLGLGLAVAQNAIQSFGGTVKAESRFGKGSSISFALPLAEDCVEMAGSLPADHLLNRYSPVYVQLSGYCRLPGI